MFFPIGDDQVHGGHKPLLSYALILINTFVFLYEFSLTPGESEVFINHLGQYQMKLFTVMIFRHCSTACFYMADGCTS